MQGEGLDAAGVDASGDYVYVADLNYGLVILGTHRLYLPLILHNDEQGVYGPQ